MFKHFTSLQLKRNDIFGQPSDEESLWLTVFFFEQSNSKRILQNRSSYTAQKFFSSVAAVFANSNAKNSREGGGFYTLQCLLCSADTDLPTDSGARDTIDCSIDYKYTLQFLPVHLLRVKSSANASLYTQVTCDLSLNTDSHTGFFRATAVGLCPSTCNERCTRVLRLLPLRSYACVIIALFSVVFHPTRAVHNIDLRFVSNRTHNQRRPVECDTNSDEQQIPKFLTRTYAGFSRSNLFSSVECSRDGLLHGIPYVVVTQALK